MTLNYIAAELGVSNHVGKWGWIPVEKWYQSMFWRLQYMWLWYVKLYVIFLQIIIVKNQKWKQLSPLKNTKSKTKIFYCKWFNTSVSITSNWILFQIQMVLMLAGDVETNPGPQENPSKIAVYYTSYHTQLNNVTK